MAENVLEVDNLYKKYGKYVAVDGISFVVPKGKVIGLLGPNGAGKTTTIQMLTGITLPNSGTIKYFGKDFAKDKQACLQKINFTSAYNYLQGRISVWENLLVFAYLYGLKNPQKKINDMMEYFEITQLRNERFWDLSAGQKTRVNVVKSLLNDPELLLMDEPTASLDPDIADKMLTLIEDLNKSRSLSILYTSHNMDEVTRICDEVIFLDRGKIVAQDTPLGLTKRIEHAKLTLTFDGDKEAIEKYLTDQDVEFDFKGRSVVHIKTREKLIPKLIFGMSNTGEKTWITNIDIEKPHLEDVFLQIARKEQVA